MTDITGLVAALRSYGQADEDGVMCIVSRQACEEAADELERLTAALATAEETGRRKGISQAAMTADNTRWRHRPGANQKNVEVINRITGAFGKVIADYIRSLMDKPTS